MREHQTIMYPDTHSNIKLSSIPDFDIEEYDLNNTKDLMRFFFQVEKVCRGSRLYKNLINYLRDYSDMNKCSFFNNVNNLDTYSIKIHIHHTPLTLFDIVTIIYNKKLANNEYISVNSVAKEVMYNHYNMKVGLIPLSETVHEIVHSGYLFIPTNIVFGYYKTFIKDYDKYIPSELKTSLSNNEEISNNYDYKKETKILEYDPIYIDASGVYKLPKVEDIIKLLEKRDEN